MNGMQRYKKECLLQDKNMWIVLFSAVLKLSVILFVNGIKMLFLRQEKK